MCHGRVGDGVPNGENRDGASPHAGPTCDTGLLEGEWVMGWEAYRGAASGQLRGWGGGGVTGRPAHKAHNRAHTGHQHLIATAEPGNTGEVVSLNAAWAGQ